MSRAPTACPRDPLSNFCEVIIEGVETKAFLDTGAGISLISDKFRQSCHLLRKKKIETNMKVKASSVNNEPVQIMGVLELRVLLGDKEIFWPLYVTKEMYPVLLGWDYIRANNIVIDSGKGEISIGGSTVTLLPIWRVFPRVCSATIKTNQTVPPRTKMMVAVRLEPLKSHEVVPDGYQGVMEPDGIFSSDEGLMIARSAGTVEKGCTWVQVMNITESPIDIHQTGQWAHFMQLWSRE